VTSTQLAGYGLAFAGVCYYNYRKIQAMKLPSTATLKAPEKGDKAEEEGLLNNKEYAKGQKN
jgi:hypothetical protein